MLEVFSYLSLYQLVVVYVHSTLYLSVTTIASRIVQSRRQSRQSACFLVSKCQSDIKALYCLVIIFGCKDMQECWHVVFCTN